MNQSISSPTFGKPNYLKLVIATLLGTAPFFYSSIAVSAETTPESKAQSMETITVTGEKVNRSLKKTTTAVSVIDSDQFENGQYSKLNDLVTLSPDVISEGFGSVSIRGISGTGAATGQYAYMTGSRSRIATIVDGVTQRWTGYAYSPAGLWDVKQVEVLRGPQSTSQGTNAIGGALVSTTNDPTFQYEAAVRGGLENYENGNIKKNAALMFNAPIIDNELAMRVAIDGLKGEGWMNYEDESTVTKNVDPNDSENLNVRTKFLWEPASMPGLSAKLTYNYHKYKGEFLTWVNDSDDDYGSQTLTLKTRSQDGNTRIQDTDVHSIAADVNYDFDNGIQNTFHADYQVNNINFFQYPYDSTTLDNDLKSFEIDNRVSFSFPASSWTGMAGVYLNHEKNEFTVDNNYAGYTSYQSSATTDVYAVYGEATYALTPVWNLIGGGRLEHNTIDRDMTFHRTADEYLDQDDSDTVFLPKVGATYDVTESTTLGANIRRGYNAGGAGLNMTSYEYYAFDKETVWAYELSSRTQFGNRASLAANLFYNDYDGYQAQSNSEITNVDSAHTYGLELEGNFWATNSLMLRGSAGLMNSKIDSNTDGIGNSLPNTPHTNVGLGFTQYLGEDFSFGADAKYVGEYYSDLDNESEYKAGDYITADARLQYIWGDLTIDGYVKNLTNEDVVLYVNSYRASVGQTRTYGVNLTYKM